MTPLAGKLAAAIRQSGPMTVEAYMAAALGDPEFGYYMTRDPLGVRGDFITAPEISQVFGEIVGLWCADLWQRLGAPQQFVLAELGPGRGTLMADLLRALKVLPPCRDAARVHLVETSPLLRDRQRDTLAERHPDIRPVWHQSIDDLPAGPLLLVANEFFDALPIRQWIRERGRWRERLVDLGPDGLVFAAGAPADPVVPDGDPAEGTIFETGMVGTAIAEAIGRRLAGTAGAALVIDYGYVAPGFGDTLQALKAHAFDPPLAHPGEADLTAHVCFGSLAEAARRAGAETYGPLTQARFLRRNGIEARTEALMRGKPPEAARAIRGACHRLIDPAQMGTLFKALALTSPGLPRPGGF